MSDHIVVLDGFTLNPGDIDWGPVSSLGSLEIHDRTADDQIIERASGANCLLLNKTPINRTILDALPQLKYIGVLATGYNVVDTVATAERGIIVTNIPTYGTDSVAQHVAALLLEFARGVGVHNQAVHEGEWTDNADWCFSRQPMFELTGRTLGIVGIGRIGQAVARIGAAMGMTLIAHDLFWPDAEKLAGLEVEQVELDDLFARSDAISLHCPLTSENHHLVNGENLKRMKPNAILINTSRGPLIDNQALADALHAGTIAGAALDVLDTEPPPSDNPLLKAPNCLITPHIAWYAVEARQRLMQIAAENVQAFLAGNPRNVVS
ncbi:MAG: D-2-hydroxyacid dehydrogenase [bacterium]|nr:D-2-hydroxyacid dehydrogenase [Gammaproteobacteria bacterium]